MVQLRTQRTALILYSVLLVLPTLVLGSLQWEKLRQEYDEDRLAIPDEANNAAARLRGAIHEVLVRLLDAEERRPYTDYGSLTIATDASLAEATPVTSPLVNERRPAEVLAWFTFDLEARDETIDVWAGAGGDPRELAQEYVPALTELMTRYNEEVEIPAVMLTRWEQPKQLDVPLWPLVFNRMHMRLSDCLQEGQEELSRLKASLRITPFHVQFFVDKQGEPKLFATRRVFLRGPVGELTNYSQCFDDLAMGMALVQGFLIDPDWFFRDLPARFVKTALVNSQRFVAWGGPPCCGDDDPEEFHALIHLLGDLGIETNTPAEQRFAPMRVATDTRAIDADFHGLRWRFLGLGAMLLLSLGTGMWLLLRSVRKDLEQATRTENFVAAVTHELRTPLTSIKMHGELLLDGDAREPEKQREYYKRIVRATERLGTLVERVLEKSRLSAGGVRAEPGDLNSLVQSLERQLAQYGPEGDIMLDLDAGLPDVLLTNEAVTSIVSNLVENARKYAPVDTSQPGAEPILVRTRAGDGEVTLEVLDRGPGVPEAERGKIFEAFYRVGTEATRTARGAGLGLHLVLLQARSIGGDAGHLPREGGGSIFWVHFVPAGPNP